MAEVNGSEDIQFLEYPDKEPLKTAFRKWRDAVAAYHAAKEEKVSEEDVDKLQIMIEEIYDNAQLEAEELEDEFNAHHGLSELSDAMMAAQSEYEEAVAKSRPPMPDDEEDAE